MRWLFACIVAAALATATVAPAASAAPPRAHSAAAQRRSHGQRRHGRNPCAPQRKRRRRQKRAHGAKRSQRRGQKRPSNAGGCPQAGGTVTTTPALRAGVGRADITPPTGYYMQGWVRSDAKTTGQHTRLFARVIVLEEHGRKLALVAEDLNGIAGGMLVDAAALVADRGFSERNVLDSASHTHAAQGQYFNFGTYNTVFPTTGTLTSFNTAGDPQLYGFMVRQLAAAIRRADDNLGPAVAAWGTGELLGVTQNRSLEAHLANYNVFLPPGQGMVSQDPMGYPNTIDPSVDVLRVDRVEGDRHFPIGMWSNFADHGTVNKFTFHYYNADHHGAATRVIEDTLRSSGHVPASQDVVDAYGNGDEGDMSAGLGRSGPVAADDVGRREAAAMLKLWSDVGSQLSGDLPLDLRWTRICFCGQETEGGAVASVPVVGLPLTTGSEEGRGPLYDITQTSFEGVHAPVSAGPQGDKIPFFPDATGTTPRAVPLMAVRIGDRMIVSVPGEMTVEMGRRVKAAVADASRAAGIKQVVISGLANEYLQYFTTPEEYDQQHYEGGSTLFGRVASNLLKGELTDLAGRLVAGQPAPEPYAFDPTNGFKADNTAFDSGATAATATQQPNDVHRLVQTSFAWQGGQRGFDRPLDKPFVTIRVKDSNGAWARVTDDLGLQVLWKVDAAGVYTAIWEVPLDAPAGTYEFLITANGYKLESHQFAVSPLAGIALEPFAAGAGSAGVTLSYPPNKEVMALAGDGTDITLHPAAPDGGSVTFLVDGKRQVVDRPSGARFTVTAPAGAHVTVPAGGARDRYDNSNPDPLVLAP
ncbi:MAG TPA: neutral/alkaline non-lysosomal ceramidase N-terminal domain-containing protein [Solirubrobacteraceae bacterium]|nr:neutral/alkaline non-lysosomal ceramidase N-terminal domain-containing protein [Solirubrobacteraceae bacterium]